MPLNRLPLILKRSRNLQKQSVSSTANMWLWSAANTADTYQLMSLAHELWLRFAIWWRRSICRIYRHINISEWGATLFIGSGGSCYHPSPELLRLSVSLISTFFFFFFWAHPSSCISTVSVCRLLSTRICPSLPVCVQFFLPPRAACNTLWGFTRIRGFCSNASFHFMAKLSLIVCRTGSALAAFVNVKYAAPRAGFYWAGLWNRRSEK